MARNSVGIVVLLVVFCLASSSDSQDYWGMCFPRAGHADWQLSITIADGFCFHYPPRYKAIFADRTEISLAQKLRPQAHLTFWLDETPFRLDELARMTASGNAPEPTEIGGHTFYYSGHEEAAGFSDYYFFNLRGKLLHIDFLDSYVLDSSSHETKESEVEILKTFRLF